MRLDLPGDVGQLEKGLDQKVRNQVKKGRKNGLEVSWGGPELLDDFYAVFSREHARPGHAGLQPAAVRQRILEQFPDRAELCVVRAGAAAAGGGAAAARLGRHGGAQRQLAAAPQPRPAPTC